MVIYVRTLILSVGGNMKLMMTLTLWLVPLKTILEIIYIYMDL